MKILQINKFLYPRGGAETHMLSLAKLLENHNNEVGFFSTKSTKTLPTPFDKYFIPESDLRNQKSLPEKIKTFKNILWSKEAAANLEKLLEYFKPDVAHLHNIYYHLSPSILPVLKKHRLPTALTLHDYKLLSPNYQLFLKGKIDESSAGKNYWRCAINRCVFNSFPHSAAGAIEAYYNANKYLKKIDLFISPSQFLKNKFVQYGWPKEKIEILPNFVSPKNIDIQNQKLENYILYFGRLSEEKGLKNLLSLAEFLPNVSVHIVGTGPLTEELSKIIAIKKINNVKLLGFKSGQDLEQEILKAKMVVMPSLWYENCPLSALESLSYGKCLIASNIGGLPEIIEDGISGVLAKPGDTKDWAVKISNLWDNEERIKQIGLAAKKRADEKNNPESYYKKIMEIYNKIITSY